MPANYPHRLFVLLFVAFGAAGCAFDVISIGQTPANFVAESSLKTYELENSVKVGLPEGSASRLNAGTRWQKIGHIEQGDVYETSEQIVTVVASNQHEAKPVIREGQIVGFYLRVQQSFTPASKPVPFDLRAIN